jgi:putative zinc finger/helix-turn-helix YgiT family protein
MKGTETMKAYCPNCEDDRNILVVDTIEDIEVRGERIPTRVHYLKCQICGSDFTDPTSEYDPLPFAYREYRKRKGYLQPEDIVAFRKRWGLTQQELASLLGWGVASLSRYENGSLQSAGSDAQLHLAMQPGNLYRLIQDSGPALTQERRRTLTGLLRQDDGGPRISLPAYIETVLGSYCADNLSGFRSLDFGRLTQAIVFFASNLGVCATALNKLLWYADFLSFKRHGTSITGMRYQHHFFGPVPVGYDLVLAALVAEGTLDVEERFVCRDLKPYYVPRLPFSDSVFTKAELEVLTTVRDRFGRWTATRLWKKSHLEQAYLKTQQLQLIPYDLASTLSI